MYARLNEPMSKADTEPASQTPLAALNDVTDWVPVSHLSNPTIQIKGIAGGGIVQIQGTLEPDPATDTAPAQLGSDATVDGIYAIEKSVDWVRLKLTTVGASSVKARFAGDKV